MSTLVACHNAVFPWDQSVPILQRKQIIITATKRKVKHGTIHVCQPSVLWPPVVSWGGGGGVSSSEQV